MSVATFKMDFYPLYLKSYEKFQFFNVGHFGLQIAALMGKITDGSDRVEISIPKLTYKSMSCF